MAGAAASSKARVSFDESDDDQSDKSESLMACPTERLASNNYEPHLYAATICVRNAICHAMCNNYLCDTSSCNTSICNIIGN